MKDLAIALDLDQSASRQTQTDRFIPAISFVPGIQASSGFGQSGVSSHCSEAQRGGAQIFPHNLCRFGWRIFLFSLLSHPWQQNPKFGAPQNLAPQAAA